MAVEVANAKEVIDRVTYLRYAHQNSLVDRYRFKSIVNGGANGIRELLGTKFINDNATNDIPIPNLMASGLERLAQKIGRAPSTKVDIFNAQDSTRAKQRRDKLERIVHAYDDLSDLKSKLPQVARWLPGYGFAVFVITTKQANNGAIYPSVELRDPYDCYFGYGVDEPEDLGVVKTIPKDVLLTQYPFLKPKFAALEKGKNQTTSSFNYGILHNVDGQDEGSWESMRDIGETVVEYYNQDGTYIVHPGFNEILEFVPNPLISGPQFVVAKKYSFDKIQGQFDQVIGLMSSMAKMNVMSIIAMEDAVFTETNVTGELESGQYRKGRFAINYLTPGSQVSKPVSNLPYQLFEMIGRIERQLRVVAGYPVQDDSISPNSFVTGRGLEELQSGVNMMVREYQEVLQKSLQLVDQRRLELDEVLFADNPKPIAGYYRGAAFSENYRPSKDIAGNHMTRRVYGAMASFDEPQKIVTGLQLLQAGIIDRQTLQEEMDGLENITAINDRITKEKAERVLFESLLQRSQQGDSGALLAIVDIFNKPAQMGDILKLYFTPQEPEMTPEEEAFVQTQAAQPQAGPQAPAAPPSIQQALGLIGG